MMRKAVKILLIVVVFAAACLPAVYINSLYGYLPVFTLAAAFVLSVLCLHRIRRKITVESDVADGSCQRGSQISAGLKIVNRSKLMSARSAANVFTSDLFGGTESASRVWFTLAPGEHTGFGLNLKMPHIGVYRAGIRNMEMWDFFGVFRVQVPVEGEFDVFVRPRIRPMEELWESETVLAEASRDTRTTVLNGMDYVGVREYVMGDSMKQVHWKLSAHSLGYMTKLQESSRETSYAVILDFAAEKQEDREVLMDIQDSLVETALSIVDAVAKHHTNYGLLYCNREHQVKKVTPKGREDDLDLIRDFSVITPEPGGDYPDGCRILQEEGSVASRSTNVILCTSRVTDELLQELLRIRRQRRVPELYQILPAGLNSRQAEAYRARLRQLDDAGVSHHFIYTTDAGGGAA